MLDVKMIRELFQSLNEKLEQNKEIGEVGIVGGTVMCLVYQSRLATRDVDAVFEPAQLIRKLVADIGEEKGIARDWLNDAVKGYVQGQFGKQDVLNLPNLRVWAPEAKYMLTMKCLSARWDTNDGDDVKFLIRHLKIKSAKVVFEIIEKYYPKNQIPSKTLFFIEEIFEKSSA